MPRPPADVFDPLGGAFGAAPGMFRAPGSGLGHQGVEVMTRACRAPSSDVCPRDVSSSGERPQSETSWFDVLRECGLSFHGFEVVKYDQEHSKHQAERGTSLEP